MSISLFEEPVIRITNALYLVFYMQNVVSQRSFQPAFPKKSHFVQQFFEKDGLTYGNYFLCLVLDL